MPIYEYKCDCGVLSIDVTTTWRDRKESVPCGGCGKDATSIPTAPGAVYPPYPSMDGGAVWEGTPLEGSDGHNPTTFVSDKPFVDLGSK